MFDEIITILSPNVDVNSFIQIIFVQLLGPLAGL